LPDAADADTPSAAPALLIIVVMGVSGTGKTTLGHALAERLNWVFIEADDFHPPQNVEKMRSGQPLSEGDRAPWLAAVHAALLDIAARQVSAVLACSALKRAHRKVLSRDIADLHFVYLEGDPDLVSTRLRQRRAHFMPAHLLGSQLATLEPPGDAITLSIAVPTEQQVDLVIDRLAPAIPQ
jgi:carbohydrate kinase (thermoresistant glucokinase family)